MIYTCKFNNYQFQKNKKYKNCNKPKLLDRKTRIKITTKVN